MTVEKLPEDGVTAKTARTIQGLAVLSPLRTPIHSKVLGTSEDIPANTHFMGPQ